MKGKRKRHTKATSGKRKQRKSRKSLDRHPFLNPVAVF